MKITGQLLRSRSRRPLHLVRYIDLSSTNIVTLDHLDLCPKLTTLVARNNRLEDISKLDCCPQLWKVDIAHNKLRALNGLSRFSVLGSLILSNNCLDWNDLEKLCHINILELSLHGNPLLEKDPYYRIHVIDSLPLLWMLDGKLITSAERHQVDIFFKDTELAERPVRHKLAKSRFIPTALKNLPVTGVFGEKTEHWMKRFPLQETLSTELDKRRLRYLAYNLTEDVLLQSDYVVGIERITNDLFLNVVDQRESDEEKCNMLLLLLMAFLEFRIPWDVIYQTLYVAKLNKIGSLNTNIIFQLSKNLQCRVASLLLAGVKIDRDAKLGDGLYYKLYVCLSDLVSKWHKLSNGDDLTRKPCIRNILAEEVVQLFCIVPAFLMFVGKDAGLLELVSSATNDPEIADNLNSILLKGDSKNINSGDIFQEIGLHILEKLQAKSPQPVKPPVKVTLVKPKACIPLRTTSYKNINDTDISHQNRSLSALCIGRKIREIADISSDKARKSVRKLSTKKPKGIAIGDKVFTESQDLATVVALPDKNIAVVRKDISGSRSNFIKTLDTNNQYSYVNIQTLQWFPIRGLWCVKNDIEGDYKDEDTKPKLKQNEVTTGSFVSEIVKKHLPVELWMSISPRESTSKDETTTSDQNEDTITTHVRELVKECIREANVGKEEVKSDQHVKLMEKQNVKFEETNQTPSEDDQVIDSSVKEFFSKYEIGEAFGGWEDLPDDDDLISKTENARLDAWKYFHLRSLEDRIIPTKDRFFSVTRPQSSKQSPYSSPRQPEHRSFSPVGVCKNTGKRLSYPLPGWMDELHLNNQRSSCIRSAGITRKPCQTQERWTPIITPAPTSRSDMKKRSPNVIRAGRIHGKKRHQSAQAILKRA